MMTSDPASPLFITDDAPFRERFDREPFAFAHRIAQSELFTTERVMALANQMAQDPADVYYDAGDVSIGQRWSDVPPSRLGVDGLLERITTANAWIILRRLEKFPEYAALLDDCIAEIERRTGLDLARVMKLRNAILFINSPNRISTYHIDRECSCLFQIRGIKDVSVFDRTDRDVLTEEELERFWSVDNNAAVYKPHLQDRATVFTLAPGDAIHIPTNAPHWVQNGPDVSISLNVNFHYKDHLLADLYRTNHALRRLGLRPKPPHASRTGDAVKRALYASAVSLKRSQRTVAQLAGRLRGQ